MSLTYLYASLLALLSTVQLHARTAAVNSARQYCAIRRCQKICTKGPSFDSHQARMLQSFPDGLAAAFLEETGKSRRSNEARLADTVVRDMYLRANLKYLRIDTFPRPTCVAN
ncbi:hypothetical protein C8J57DRAFT_1498221 [Mycena rebaudengoi]|nr:hypothetical protein C8J57DRAFT_1498221 [Mycena rebaudengoi]